MKILLSLLSILFLHLQEFNAIGQTYQKGALLYSALLSDNSDTAGWKMEGAGKVEFSKGWMQLFSPDEKGNLVFWCPQDFPENFIAEWEVQNLNTEAGLCIVFFAAKGLKGEDIFDESLPKRDGTFKNYTKGAINNYHISYYANGKNEPGRETAHLRKNKGFYKVQAQEPGIPLQSTAVHKLQLIKHKGRIVFTIDERTVIDWPDNGQQFGKILEGGKIGFRQMKWTKFAYSNFSVWDCLPR